MSIYDDNFILIYTLILAFILGSVFGSFLNCMADRISNHEKWWTGRSKCDACGHTLSILDLFPVFSYIFLKGKCRYCGSKLSIRYVISEALLGVLFVIILVVHGTIDFELFNELGLVCVLYGLSLCDLKTYEIPDGFILFGIIWWIIFNILEESSIGYYIGSLISAVVISGSVLLISLLMDKVLKKESMGGGDIKLLFLVGLYLGLAQSLFNLILSCIFGLLLIVVLKKEKIPFGPAISFATYISLLYGVQFLGWYMSLLV